MPKNCPKCGKVLSEGADYCSKCGTKVKDAVKTPPRTELFDVNEVILSEMLASVYVVPTNADRVKVTIDGDEEMKSAIKLEVSGQSLKISAPFPFFEGVTTSDFGNFGSNFFSISSVSRISIVNGQTTINGRVVNKDRTILVFVDVPVGSTIKVGKLIGKAVIGNTEGNLVVNISGSTKVGAGKIKNLSASISGSGDVKVIEVDGSIDAKVSGSGSISIEGGKATAYNASVSGAGNISFNGVANSANMNVSGVGDISLAECLSIPSKHMSGLGHIRVAKSPKQAGGFSDF